MAFDPSRDRLLATNVIGRGETSPVTVSIIDSNKKTLNADIVVPGRTRWTIFDGRSDRFFVNVADPSKIITIDSRDPDGIASSYQIPGKGPHGLDIDVERRRLFCACDEGGLFTVEIESGKVAHTADIAGSPDVIFYNPRQQHLHVAIGDPGVIEVYDTDTMKLVETITTESGAHTIAYSPVSDKVYAFLPQSHRASVWVDE